MFSYNRVSECFLHNRVSECFLKLMQLEGNIIIILLFVIDLKSIRHFAQTPHNILKEPPNTNFRFHRYIPIDAVSPSCCVDCSGL